MRTITHMVGRRVTETAPSPSKRSSTSSSTSERSFMAAAEAVRMEESLGSFVEELSPVEKTILLKDLEDFVVKHGTEHRPIVVVSSGGTAADLEINSVRALDNFSTGLRGAMSVEEFLRRGYAVVHLWRRGSASPFARVLTQALGLKQANHALDVASLGKLFTGGTKEEADSDDEDDVGDRLVETVLEGTTDDDPWCTDPAISTNKSSSIRGSIQVNDKNADDDNLVFALQRRLRRSAPLKDALRDRSIAVSDGRLLTVPFRTVEEYLGKLQLCSESLRDCQSLVMFYLAAAVSDFYIPKQHRSQHKIQSGGGPNTSSETAEEDQSLVLKLYPVPKMILNLRKVWAPEAFVVSFKLETDKTILRAKAERAVTKYKSHIVIGNMLQTRHSQVWLLAPDDMQYKKNDDNKSNDPTTWEFQSIAKQDADDTSLESTIVDSVVQCHFEYISYHWKNTQGDSTAGMEAALQGYQKLQQRKKQRQQQILTEQMQKGALKIAGAAAGALLSSMIFSALQRRAFR